MYVKWEDRWTRRGTAAVLVESSRVGGKPRQRHIAYLGTYPSSLFLIKDDAHNVHTRAWFWHRMVERLAILDLTVEQRKHIIALAAKRVPKPTREEITNYDQAERARLRRQDADPVYLRWPPRTLGVARRRGRPPKPGSRFLAFLKKGS